MTISSPKPEQRLLDTASRLFYAEGIHAVGIDRVLAEASVAKGTLYGHFASKENLVAAYLSRQSDEWAESAEQRLTGQVLGTAAAVVSLFELLYESSQEPAYRGCPFINAAAEFPGAGPVGAVIARHRRRVRDLFRQAGGPVLAETEVLDAIVALYGGAMSAAHMDHDPDVVLHAARAAERLLAA